MCQLISGDLLVNGVPDGPLIGLTAGDADPLRSTLDTLYRGAVDWPAIGDGRRMVTASMPGVVLAAEHHARTTADATPETVR